MQSRARAHRSDYKLGDLTVQENTSAAARSCRLEIKIPRVGLSLPNPSYFVAPVPLMDKLQHLGKQVFKKMPLKQRYGFLEQVRRNGISRRGIWDGCGEEFGMLKPV